MRSRAGLLISCAVGLLALAACGPPEDPYDGPEDPPDWNADFALPEAEDKNPDPDIVEVHLEAKVITREFKPGVQAELWTYNGLLPGPLIRLKKGDRLIVHFTNHLPEATTIHWHGLRVPAAMDGSEAVQNPVQPGESFTYDFVVPDAGTFWYHPHHRSSHQVNDGLYAPLIVEDPDEPDFGAELMLVLSDILINPDGTTAAPDVGGNLGDYFGREGNILLANGRTRPHLLTRTGRPMRWRIVNAARTRYFWFKLPGHRVIKIGADGGLIEAPQPIEEILLVPGERADLVVIPEGQPGDTLTVTWLAYERGFETGNRPTEPMFDITVSDLPPATPPALPDRLTVIPPIDTSDAAIQLIELTEETVEGKVQLGINGKPYWEADHVHAHAGETQVWIVRNTTDGDHPFHLHGFFFQVLDVNGQPPPWREWRDMVNVPRNQEVRIAVTFDDRLGMWMFHCHILDHAEIGMMGMLELVAPHG